MNDEGFSRTADGGRNEGSHNEFDNISVARKGARVERRAAVRFVQAPGARGEFWGVLSGSERSSLNVPKKAFGSPKGEPRTTRPTPQQMCKKLWALPLVCHSIHFYNLASFPPDQRFVEKSLLGLHSEQPAQG
jgi:hypothetical protein